MLVRGIVRLLHHSTSRGGERIKINWSAGQWGMLIEAKAKTIFLVVVGLIFSGFLLGLGFGMALFW
jgi:hypothetical protein